LVVHGLPASFESDFCNYVESAKGRWARYSPLRPDRAQRNRALTRSQLARISGESPPPIVRDVLDRYGLGTCDQLRMLVCRGRSLLAWIGVQRLKPFGSREKLLLGTIAGRALMERLDLEQWLHERPLWESLTSEISEQIAAPLFVVSGRLSPLVRHANVAGRSLLDKDRTGVLAMLRHAVVSLDGSDGDPRLSVTRLASAGIAEHFLIIQRIAPADIDLMVMTAARAFGLGPVEARVLGSVVRQLPLKTIAAEQGISRRTLTDLVANIYEKAGVKSRAELHAKVWRDAPKI
jgi:DNA-binding CsgD family transcriptional regulator